MKRTHVWRSSNPGAPAGHALLRAQTMAWCGRPFDHQPGGPTSSAPAGADCLACLRALHAHQIEGLVRAARELDAARQALELAESKAKSAPKPRRAISKTTKPQKR